MATMLATNLMTAEEYLRLPDNGVPTELVRGRLVKVNRPFTAHGYFTMRLGHLLQSFLDTNDVGRGGGRMRASSPNATPIRCAVRTWRSTVTNESRVGRFRWVSTGLLLIWRLRFALRTTAGSRFTTRSVSIWKRAFSLLSSSTPPSEPFTSSRPTARSWSSISTMTWN